MEFKKEYRIEEINDGSVFYIQKLKKNLFGKLKWKYVRYYDAGFEENLKLEFNDIVKAKEWIRAAKERKPPKYHYV